MEETKKVSTMRYGKASFWLLIFAGLAFVNCMAKPG